MRNLCRNDPCHCGSGKKYKKCHLDADQSSRVRTRPPAADSESHRTFGDVRNTLNLLRQLSKTGSSKDRKDFAGLLAQSAPLLDCLARRDEIEAAGRQLEAHRAEFEEFAQDAERLAALARTLFAEECFAPLWFTATDVQSAFDHVGHPALMAPDEQTVELLRAAILHVADKERRSSLSVELMMRLPELVRDGRHMEGCLVQCAALETVEDSGESNPFLFQMFSHGYDAWAAAKQARDEALFRSMGFDLERIRGMSLDEMDAWVPSQTSDPATEEVLEAFFRDKPHLREASVANLDAMERNSTKLLDREDSPEENSYLLTLCWRSLQAALEAGMVAAQQPSDSQQPIGSPLRSG